MSEPYPPPRIALLHGVIRREEKLLVEAFRRHGGVDLVLLDDREISFSPDSVHDFDAVLSRSVSFSRGLYARRIFEAATISMALVIWPTFFTERMRRLISRLEAIPRSYS